MNNSDIFVEWYEWYVWILRKIHAGGDRDKNKYKRAHRKLFSGPHTPHNCHKGEEDYTIRVHGRRKKDATTTRYNKNKGKTTRKGIQSKHEKIKIQEVILFVDLTRKGRIFLPLWKFVLEGGVNTLFSWRHCHNYNPQLQSTTTISINHEGDRSISHETETERFQQ